MTRKDFEKLKRLIDVAMRELDEETSRTGEIFSDNYDRAKEHIEKKIVERFGFSLQEYRQHEEDKIEEPKEEKPEINKEDIEDIVKEVIREYNIEDIARNIVKQYNKEPQVVNKIVKEITKPVIQYDNTATEELKKDLNYLREEFLALFDRKINHNDLDGITEDDHHQKIHSLISHLDDEYLHKFKELISGQETTLHKHPEIEEEIRVVGSRVTERIIEKNGEVSGVVIHNDNPDIARPTGYKNITWIGEVEPNNAIDNDVWFNNE